VDEPEADGKRVKAATWKALLRFWWIVVAGALIATVAAIAVVKREYDQRTHLATARLLVTSSEAPYYRIGVTDLLDPATLEQEAEAGSAAATEEGGGEGGGVQQPQRPVLVNDKPDLTQLIQAANLYPLLIESDPVKALRKELYGELPGNVSARGIFSVVTPGRFEQSPVPVIELNAEADRPGQAIRLAQATSDTFIRWITDQQKQAGLTDRQRIIVQPLLQPTQAVPSSGSPVTLAALVLLVVWAAFIALAFALNRLFPRKPRRVPEPAKVGGVEHVDRPAGATKP
jgi:hypothetical protein